MSGAERGAAAQYLQDTASETFVLLLMYYIKCILWKIKFLLQFLNGSISAQPIPVPIGNNLPVPGS
jgi:hypothetical protein